MYGPQLLPCFILLQLLVAVLPAAYHEDHPQDHHHMFKRQSGRQNGGQPVVTNNNPGQIPPPAVPNNPNQGGQGGQGGRQPPPPAVPNNPNRGGQGGQGGRQPPPPAVPNNPNRGGQGGQGGHGGQGGQGGQGGTGGRTGIAGLPDPGKPVDTRGTEFIFCFTSNVGNALPRALKVLIGALGPAETMVSVSVPTFKFSKQQILLLGETTIIDIPPAAAAVGSGPQNGTVWVRANRPITVHGISAQQKSHDGFLAIPAFGLGLEYFVMSYPARGNERSQMLITGVQDYTRLQIEPIQRILFNGRWFNIGDTILLTINRLQSVQIQSPGDLTGTRILADKPVSVMSGATCSLVPANLNRCDHLVENIPPVETWGRRFSLVPFRNRTTGHVIRIMAARPNTKFTTLGQVFVLARGGLFREINQPVTFPMSIVSDKPLLVVQFAKGGQIDKTGDPFMTVIPPVEQYVAGAVTFNTFDQSGRDVFKSFASISVTSWDLFNVYVNNEPLLSHSYGNQQRDWARLQTFDADYQMPLAPGASTIASPAPNSRFTAIIYGFTDGTSYAFPAVYGLRRLLCTSKNTARADPESDCTGPIISGIVISDKHGPGVGIQPPKGPLFPGMPKPPGGGRNDLPGWGNFDPSKTGSAWNEEGGADAGVFFPWYTIPPWQADRWVEEQDDDDSECYTNGLIALSTIAPSAVVFIVMLIITCALYFRKPVDSKF